MNYIWDKNYEIKKETIEIGDVVINQHGTKSVVVRINEKGIILCYANMETKLPSFYIYDEDEARSSLCILTGEKYEYMKDIFS